MNPLTKIILLSLLSSCGGGVAWAEEQPSAPHKGEDADMLRFANHDTLHGEFIAFNSKGNLQWKSPESPDPIVFDTQKAHRIILNHGQAHKAIHYKSAVHLINGDVIPGSILSADDTSVMLETEHLGNLTIPRDTITRIAPKPFGGKLLYYGPLSTDGWKTMSPEKPKPKPDPKEEKKEEKAAPKPEKKAASEEEEKDKKTDWQHVANAWYAGSDQTKYLVREDALPDKCKLTFKLAWRGSLYANIILHADFAPPEANDETKPNRNYNPSAVVGHAYTLNITNHSASLTALTYGEDGKLHIDAFNETRASLRLTGKDQTLIELRIDKPNKSILLYADGSFKCKWSLGDTYAGKGNTLAFHNPRYNNAELRISDIAICHWNGMKDSAESMSSTQRDIILLNNGIDRFSGVFNHLRDGLVSFEGTYDNAMMIPVEEVHEIYLATGKQKPLPETVKKAVHFFIYPYGRITGSPSATANSQGKTKLSTDLLGDLELDTRFINIIDFSQKNSLLDIWDDNF